MDITAFVSAFAEQFDDTDPSEIKASTEYHELDEWSSLLSMSVIAMVKTDYDVTITGKDVKECNTIQQLFDLVKSKK